MRFTSFYSFLASNSYLLPLGLIGLTLITLVLTLLPSEALGHSRLWDFDKLGHLVLFGGWTFFLGLYHHISRSSTNMWIIFILGVSFGLLIEILQYALPLNRQADFLDLIFDTLGCALGILALKGIIPEKKPSDYDARTKT